MGRGERVSVGGPLHEDRPGAGRASSDAIDALNAKQASYSTIKKFAILPKDFTQEAAS